MAKAPEPYEECRLEYDRLARTYGLIDGIEQVDESIIRLLAKYLRPGSHILDLGAGPGNYSRRLATLGHSVVALDNSPEMIREIYRRGVLPGMLPLSADMRTVEFERGIFDGILANSSLIHLVEYDLPPVLSALSRAVAPGGHMLANFAISDKGLRFLRTSRDEFSSSGRFFQHYPDTDTVVRYLTQSAFEIIETTRRVVRPLLADGTRGHIEWLNVVARPSSGPVA